MRTADTGPHADLYAMLTARLRAGETLDVRDTPDDHKTVTERDGRVVVASLWAPKLAHLTHPGSLRYRTRAGLTSGGRGAVLRVRVGAYRWFPDATWVADDALSEAGLPAAVVALNPKGLRWVETAPPVPTPAPAPPSSSEAPAAAAYTVIARDGDTLVVRNGVSLLVARVVQEISVEGG